MNFSWDVFSSQAGHHQQKQRNDSTQMKRGESMGLNEFTYRSSGNLQMTMPPKKCLSPFYQLLTAYKPLERGEVSGAPPPAHINCL